MSIYEIQSMIAKVNKKSKPGPMDNETLDKLMAEHKANYDWIK